MRIGVLTTSYPRRPGDIAGSFVRGMARFLVREGFDVEVVCAGAPGQVGESWDEGIVVRRVAYAWPYSRMRLFYEGGAPEALSSSWASWLQVPAFGASFLWTAEKQALKWDALVSHFLIPSGLVGVLVAKGRPHLAVAHSADVALMMRLGPLGKLFAHAFAGEGTIVNFVSEHLREQFARLSLRVARLGQSVPMGVEKRDLVYLPGREHARARLGLGMKEFVVLFLGRLVSVKGVDVLLRAIAKTQGATLLVAGAGPEKENLKRLAGSLGLRWCERWLLRDSQGEIGMMGYSNYLLFLGEIYGEAKACALAAADVLCLPSRIVGERTEGAPVVIMEAQSVGLPVVASCVGGIPELVTHERDGLLVPPDNGEALALAIQRLKDDEPLRVRLAHGAYERGSTRDWHVVGQRLLGPLFKRMRG